MQGDFYVGKLAGSGVLGVVEDYTKLEYDSKRSRRRPPALPHPTLRQL